MQAQAWCYFATPRQIATPICGVLSLSLSDLLFYMPENKFSDVCENKLINNNYQKVGGKRFKKCKKEALTLYYFDGCSIISLCFECSRDYKKLGLTVRER